MFYSKYIKYKTKYLELNEMIGGGPKEDEYEAILAEARAYEARHAKGIAENPEFAAMYRDHDEWYDRLHINEKVEHYISSLKMEMENYTKRNPTLRNTPRAIEVIAAYNKLTLGKTPDDINATAKAIVEAREQAKAELKAAEARAIFDAREQAKAELKAAEARAILAEARDYEARHAKGIAENPEFAAIYRDYDVWYNSLSIDKKVEHHILSLRIGMEYYTRLHRHLLDTPRAKEAIAAYNKLTLGKTPDDINATAKAIVEAREQAKAELKAAEARAADLANSRADSQAASADSLATKEEEKHFSSEIKSPPYKFLVIGGGGGYTKYPNGFFEVGSHPASNFGKDKNWELTPFWDELKQYLRSKKYTFDGIMIDKGSDSYIVSDTVKSICDLFNSVLSEHGVIIVEAHNPKFERATYIAKSLNQDKRFKAVRYLRVYDQDLRYIIYKHRESSSHLYIDDMTNLFEILDPDSFEIPNTSRIRHVKENSIRRLLTNRFSNITPQSASGGGARASGGGGGGASG